MGSVMGFIPAPYLALYASTKHALEGYSESLDHELRAFGIRVVLVEPAYTRTVFEDNLATPDLLLDVYDLPRAGAKTAMREAMQQTGDAPEIVAETVLKAATAAFPRRRYAAGKMARQVSFLRRFVPDGTPWAHFDTFAWRPSAKPGRPKGGEAMGLRAAFAMLRRRYGA